MGVNMKIEKNQIKVLNSKNIKPISIKTEPYPGFPTDLQAQIMVLMTRAKGISKIKERSKYVTKYVVNFYEEK